MNPRMTLGLLAVLLALGGYVYFGGPSSGQANQPAAKDKPPDQQVDVLRLDDRDIQQVVARKGGQQTVLEKDADKWILQPSGETADRLRVNGLVSRLATLRATRRFAEPGNLADYGLTAPDMTLTVRQSDGTEYTLAFGAKAPAEAGTYAKLSNEPAVFVVSNAIVQDAGRLIAEPPREPPTPTPGPTSTPAPPPVEATPTPSP